MKIIFLNTYNGKCTEPLAQFFKEHSKDTDIFCLQEVSRAAQKLCEQSLPHHRLHIGAEHPSVVGIYRQATYVNGNVKTISSKTLLAEHNETSFVTYSELEVNDQPLHVCNVHGISQPGTKRDTPERLRASTEIISFMLEKEGIKIIGGDFNLLPDTESVQLFEKHGYQNLIRDYDVPTTRNRLAWDLYPPDERQYHSNYIFTNTQVTSFEVPTDIEISDHQPLILKVKM